MQIQHIFRKAVSDGLKDIFKTIPSYSNIKINDNVENDTLPFSMMNNKEESLICSVLS